MKPPRVPQELREQAEAQVRASSSVSEAVGRIIDVIWRKALGDANDRTAQLRSAADAFLHVELQHRLEDDWPQEDFEAKRRGLQRALEAMADEERS